MSSDHILFTMTGAYGVDGGIAAANRNVLRALVTLCEKRRKHLTVFSYYEGPADKPPFFPDSARFRSFQGSKLGLTAALLAETRHRPLYVFDHVDLAPPVTPLASVGAARMVIFAHGWEYWKHLSALDAWSLRVAELCLTNSEFTLRKMRERLLHFRGSACPLGLSPDFRVNETSSETSRDGIVLTACDGEDRPLGERVLLLVARMDPGERQKGHDRLLEVLPSLLERYTDIQLVFCGDGGDRARIAQAVTAKNVARAVFMPGHAPLPLLEALYGRSFAFVMPSTQEGFGLVYLEAMNYAKPCLGCFDQGAEDVIVHGETGLLIRDPYDANELTTALRRLLDDPEATRQMGRKGLARLRQHFTAEQYQARLVAEISKLL